jgi:DNA-binding GntR family transcriptional regulator
MVLASENLVMLLPNRGAIVTDIRVNEIVELFEILGALVGFIGRLAVARHRR